MLVICRKKKIDHKYKLKKLYLKGYNYKVWSKNEKKSTDKEESTDKKESVDLSDMPPLEGDEKLKEGKGLKNLTPNKLLTRLPILLAQIKTRNNSYKLKYEIRQILYLFYQHHKIDKKVYNNLINL